MKARAIRHPLVRLSIWLAVLVLSSCGAQHDKRQVSLEFTRIPQADVGGRDKHDIIEGRVTGALAGEQIVLYAKSGNWWVQPLVSRPFTRIQPGLKWTSATHLGTEYAALLVKSGFEPPPSLVDLPGPGDSVIAVAKVKGADSPPSPTILFSGYEWRVRDARSSRGGKSLEYDPTNVWTDSNGAMHLRVARKNDDWTCAEVSLQRSLGYGTYLFTVRDISGLEPSAIFAMFTWDYSQPDQSFSEVDVEIGRFGDPAAKNAKFIIQPHYVSSNVYPFRAPSGSLQHSFRWEPGHVSFQTTRATVGGVAGLVVADHDFTSGVPSPAIESVRMNLYVYGFSKVPMKNGAEVIIDKFEYLP